ncbi:DoxX family protein [Labrys sp. ZIDIC5]|uniref:DoxX family protein n=1 Tax=Labrys sedimenti TaxID=3106036 RepID=UPI002ACA03AA|nr:DoxX family protein [Labrys sp. ZIDIC5]MDZ5449247.1 DoxX family protein [Labrys sp. ZIDIC5]
MTPISKIKAGLADAMLLAGRLLLALIFVHEGTTLALHFTRTVEAMAVIGIGAPLVVGVIALQLGAGLALALGVLARIGAIMLGLFCLATATLFHMDFSSQNELLHFEKDLAIAGGMFVLSIAGSGGLSLDRLLRHMSSLPGPLRRILF